MTALTDKQTRAVQKEALAWVLGLTTRSREHPSPLTWVRDTVVDRLAWLNRQDDEAKP